MSDKSITYQDNDLLTKTECRQLFCNELRIGKTSYYKNYHQLFRFKSYGLNGAIQRIPYRIVRHLIDTILEKDLPEKEVDDIADFINFSAIFGSG